ncbi:MAG: bifunctional serine/threonine-protein kinase/formylglycine-generating enzyme family protein [Rhodanobacteraceae bacterium]
MPSEFPNIPGHRIIRRIGSGGMAMVYLAEQLGAGRKVALKVLLPEHNRDSEAVQRFENEARTIGRLDHPHIVRIFDVGRAASGEAYFSMPWLPRGDLTQLRSRRDPATIISIIRALLEALSYAHKRHVIHRDVKPENVMFDKDNNPQLADFGIALSTPSGIRLTRPGATVGSSGYMSPEQARGLPTDARTDIYSVGVMLYELLTGEMPYQGPDALSVSIAHVEDPVPVLPPAQRIWQPLIDRAMAKAPEDRYGSAEDMREALDAIAPTVLAGGSGHGDWYLAWKSWNTRHHGVLVGIAAVLLTIAGLMLLAYVRDRQINAQAAAAAAAMASTASATQAMSFQQPILTAAELDRLIREGNIRLSLGALVDPTGNNAGERFARILHTYPGNPEALAGLDALYQKLSDKITDALDDKRTDEALQLYLKAQQLADRAGVRQQIFWQAFVRRIRDRTQNALDRASRQSQANLDRLNPLADAMDLDVPNLQVSATNRHASGNRPNRKQAEQAGTGDASFAVISESGGRNFAISKQPVSRQEYARFVRVSGRRTSSCRTAGEFFSRFRSLNWADPGFKQSASQPVYCVSWRDARAYIGWLSQTSGRRYRLPSRKQWLAARKKHPDGMQFDQAAREWTYCTGPCDKAPIIANDGTMTSENNDDGFTHVGFRVVRELGP